MSQASASSDDQLLEEIRRVRAQMYELAEDSCDSDSFDDLQEVSKRLDKLVYRFMTRTKATNL